MLGLQLPISGYYLRSFEIWMAITDVFPIAGNVVTPYSSIMPFIPPEWAIMGYQWSGAS
jgi:hypothetical protein